MTFGCLTYLVYFVKILGHFETGCEDFKFYKLTDSALFVIW